MSISFLTDNPSKLLKDFKKKIDDGDIVTWSYDKDGDFTHTPDQWKNRAWLKPIEAGDRLRFNIIGSKTHELTWTIFSVYHGRFMEAMIRHCRSLYTIAQCPSKPSDNDAKPVAD